MSFGAHLCGPESWFNSFLLAIPTWHLYSAYVTASPRFPIAFSPPFAVIIRVSTIGRTPLAPYQGGGANATNVLPCLVTVNFTQAHIQTPKRPVVAGSVSVWLVGSLMAVPCTHTLSVLFPT